jgi:hypothetical protein
MADSSTSAALIVAGGAFLGAFVGNATSGLIARWTQKERIRAEQRAANWADRSRRRDATAERLRITYERAFTLIWTWLEEQHDPGAVRKLSRGFFIIHSKLRVEPGSEASIDLIERLGIGLNSGNITPEEMSTAIDTLGKLASEHVRQFDQDIPELPT